MDCAEVQRLLSAYIDAELEAKQASEVEKHLQECNACIKEYNNYQTLRVALREGSLYFRAPELLQKRIVSSMRKPNKIANLSHSIARTRWLSVAAVLLFALFGLWGLTQVLRSPAPQQSSLAQQVLASHVRSLEANHLMDVPSSDKHTVKPWFNGKLDFSPPVVDLTAQGFPLLGGRLDYLDNQPVAAIVYKHRQHVINLFIWPTSQNASQNTSATTLQGYHLISWTKAGMNYWAVSDLDLAELQQFARLIQQYTSGT